MEMRGCHCERSEAIFVFASRLVRDCFVAPLLLRNKIPQSAPPPWIPACAGMTERFGSADVLSAQRSEGLAMTCCFVIASAAKQSLPNLTLFNPSQLMR